MKPMTADEKAIRMVGRALHTAYDSLDFRLEDIAEYVPDQDNNEIPVP